MSMKLPPTLSSPSRGEGLNQRDRFLPPPPLRGRVRVGGSIATILMLVALTLAACGKKGPPGPPPGVPNTYPQNYPQQ
jgi:hypothetical protein